MQANGKAVGFGYRGPDTLHDRGGQDCLPQEHRTETPQHAQKKGLRINARTEIK